MEYLSQEGLEKLKQELEQRKTAKRKEIADQLEEAKALGDLSENTEYSSAKEAQAFNETRIQELEEIIKKAKTVDPKSKSNGQVQIGSKIKIRPLSSSGNPLASEEKEYTIVGAQEADPAEGKISNASPLGQAFMGRKSGDTVEVETPKGKTKYKIMEIK